MNRKEYKRVILNKINDYVAGGGKVDHPDFLAGEIAAAVENAVEEKAARIEEDLNAELSSLLGFGPIVQPAR